MKATVKNIVYLWFGADTPIRQFKLKLNPEMGAACQKANRNFKAPSGALQIGHYRKADKLAFAAIVLKELSQGNVATHSYD